MSLYVLLCVTMMAGLRGPCVLIINHILNFQIPYLSLDHSGMYHALAVVSIVIGSKFEV